ncbi:unnamed protein product [Soboliphyme baturini]|uniref:RING-type domain-containing protein n=1 Tax=Soboliphyme baturini TaxID=241478 RepID=A0A183IZ08_9BILA|nr:unnamed protein product [Soboliphyme baturini]
MSLECAVCSYSFAKLKRLACSHSFCSSCLEKIEFNGQIRCPYCRQVTSLRGFGIDELASRFGGQLECSNCGTNVDMSDGFWCQTCRSTICSSCTGKDFCCTLCAIHPKKNRSMNIIRR